MYSTAWRRFCCISATRFWTVNDFCWLMKVANTAVNAMARMTSADMTSISEKPASECRGALSPSLRVGIILHPPDVRPLGHEHDVVPLRRIVSASSTRR